MPRNSWPSFFLGELDDLSAATTRDHNGRTAKHLSTSFAHCWKERLIGIGRSNGMFDGKPCRDEEESSCNEVHATCAKVLKMDTKNDMRNFLRMDLPLDPCTPEEDPAPTGIPATDKTKFLGSQKLGDKMLKLKKKLKLGNKTAVSPPSKPKDCFSRMVDMPWGLMNPSAQKDEGDSKLIHILGIRKPVRAEPSTTVWGLAVHGKSGTPWFDTHGAHAADYIYQIPQGWGLPPDYYLCDSRVNPQVCGLIGGNLRHACAEWYDPFACHFCEDRGDTLQCEVRGWNHKNEEWSRVPVYPRDLLGELYRGEFHNTVDRPLFASINIPKAELHHKIKEMPFYMTQDGEADQAVRNYPGGTTVAPKILNIFAIGSWDPVPIFLPPALPRRCDANCPAPARRPTWCTRPRVVSYRARPLRKHPTADDFL